MGSKSIVALLALACTIALAFFLLGSGSEHGDGTVARGAGTNVIVKKTGADVTLEPTVPHLTEAVAPVAVRATLEAEPAVVPVAAHPWSDMLAGLTGRVIERDGAPVVGLRVELLEGDANIILDATHTPIGRPSLTVGEAVTDDEGRFTIEGAAGSAIHILALDSGGGRASIRFVEQSLEYGALTDIGDIVLPGFGTVIGIIIDEDGEPVQGAQVRLAPIPEPALQSGILDLREGCLIAFEQGTVQTIDLPMWVTSLLERLPISTAITDVDGAFRLEGVPLTVVAGGVDKSGFVATIIPPFEMNEGEKDLDEIDLEVGRIITGRVIDKLGDAVVGADVRAGALHPMFKVGFLHPPQAPAVVTDENGDFEIPGISDLGLVVAVARRETGEAWVTAKAAAGSSYVEVILPAAAALTVYVHDDAGEPIEGAKVTVRPQAAGRGMMSMGVMGMLGQTGRPDTFKITETEPGQYVVADLSLGKWIVRAEVNGRAMAESEIEHLTEATACMLVCHLGRTITVYVTDAASGAAVQAAHVRVIGPTESLFGAVASDFTDDTGTAQIGPIARKGEEPDIGDNMLGIKFELRLVVEHPRYGLFDIEVPGGEEVIIVALTPACEINGRITWAGSSPSELYMVALTRDEPGSESVLAMMFSTPRTTLSNLEGGFRFTGLAAGQYEIHVMRRFLNADPFEFIAGGIEPELIYRTGVDVEVGVDNVVAIELEANGEGPKVTFEGRIVVEGEPVVGATVTIRGKTNQELTTDVFGEFQAEPVVAIGSYRIKIEGEVLLPDGSTGKRELYNDRVRPNTGGVHRIDVDIDYEPVTVEVVDAVSGASVDGATVTLGKRNSGTTGSDGQVEIIVEKRGQQWASATASGFAEYGANVNIDPQLGTPQLRIELMKSAPCAGRVILPPNMSGATEMVYLLISEKGERQNQWEQVDPGDLTFDISGLSEGEFTARIWGDGARIGSVEFVLGPGGDMNLVLDFSEE